MASFRAFTLRNWSDPRSQALFQTLADELGGDIFLAETSYITNQMDRISISSGSLFFDLTVVISTYHYELVNNNYNKYCVEVGKEQDITFLTESDFEFEVWSKALGAYQ